MKVFHFFLVIFVLSVLTSCESNTFLRSKKKLDKDLQGYWSPVYGTSNYGTFAHNNNILWRFDGGKVYVIRLDEKGLEVIVDQGHYSINAKIDEDFLTITDLASAEYLKYGFNIKWNIIDVGDNVLDIAGTPNNSGRVEIEFVKTKN